MFWESHEANHPFVYFWQYPWVWAVIRIFDEPRTCGRMISMCQISGSSNPDSYVAVHGPPTRSSGPCWWTAHRKSFPTADINYVFRRALRCNFPGNKVVKRWRVLSGWLAAVSSGIDVRRRKMIHAATRTTRLNQQFFDYTSSRQLMISFGMCTKTLYQCCTDFTKLKPQKRMTEHLAFVK